MAAPCMKNYKSKPPFSGKWGRTVILFCDDFLLYNGQKKVLLLIWHNGSKKERKQNEGT